MMHIIMMMNPAIFGFDRGFMDGLSVVGSTRRTCVIDRTGEYVIYLERDYTLNTYSYKGVDYKYVDMHGNFIRIQEKVSRAGSFSCGRAYAYSIAQNGHRQQRGYIGLDGNFVINSQFERAMPFAEGLAAVQIDG